MREIIAEQAAKPPASDMPNHYAALALLAAVALIPLAIVMAVDWARKRHR